MPPDTQVVPALPPHHHIARFVWGIVALLVVLIIATIVYYWYPRIHGTLWISGIDGNGSPFSESIVLTSLATTTQIAHGAGIDTTLAALPSPTNNSIAYLAISTAFKFQIAISASGDDRLITATDVKKQDLAWAPDGNSLAFATIGSSTPDERRNLDAYTVVRALLSGAEVAVGNGIHPIPLPGNQTLALTSRGVEALIASGTPSTLLIATKISPSLGTPLAASLDGSLIAWVNPMDYSLQVFMRNPGGQYIPKFIKTDVAPLSLTFSPDGAYLMMTVDDGMGSTQLAVMSLTSGTISTVGDIPGSFKLNAWKYE